MKDYFSRYGLEYNPFLKNAKQVIVDTKEAREVQTRLDTLKDIRGFGLLTGSPGNGKSTCIRRWAGGLNPSLYKVVYSSLSTLTVMEFYRHLAEGLGAEPGFRKSDNHRVIQAEINRYYLEKRITPVIIIDEADHMGSKILQELKILFNFDMDSQDRAVVLLCGLPYLNNTLNMTAHEALRQRLVMNYNMEGISKEEGREYIRRKLEAAGNRSMVFDEGAQEAILNAANGIPRMINKLCNASLLIGGSNGINIIDAETARKAVEDTRLG